MIIEVAGHEVEVSKPDKELFSDHGTTKSDLAEYYRRIGETMLPHVGGRAVTMHRFPDGIEGDDFYQKAAPDYFPDWIERANLPKEDGDVDYVVIEDVATLVYLAGQACITPHVTLSRVDRPDHPDRMVFDMDPPEDSQDLEALHESVEMVRDLLDELDLESRLMTTGSKGYHILVPLDRSWAFEEVRDFAHRIGELGATRHEDSLTIEQRKSKRGGRIFVDYLRNSFGQTTVAPYAVRALPGAPVAAPLEWDELTSSEPGQYTTGNIFRRLSQRDDPWADLDGRSGQSLSERGGHLDDLISDAQP